MSRSSRVTACGAPEAFESCSPPPASTSAGPSGPAPQLTWDRVSEWEIEERQDDVVLTLQGGGSATPLLIPGWSGADLEALLRQLSEQPDRAGRQEKRRAPVDGAGSRPVVVAARTRRQGPDESRTRDHGPTRRTPRPLLPWKTVVTIVLLGVLATAVTIVLLQSAGIISWSILGPTS